MLYKKMILVCMFLSLFADEESGPYWLLLQLLLSENSLRKLFSIILLLDDLNAELRKNGTQVLFSVSDTSKELNTVEKKKKLDKEHL